jgi:uncharacterized membrane protein YfhO
VTIESGLNTYGMVNGILNDWNYASRSLFSDPHDDIQNLVDKAKQESPEFFRLSNLDAISPNDSLNFGYSDVSFFSSMRNRHSSSLLDTLGFRSAGTNLNIRYANNTILMDSFVAMKYNIAKSDVAKYGFEELKQSGPFTLYQNKNAFSLGFMTNENIQHFKLDTQDNLLSQRHLFNTLANDQEDYFSFISPEVLASENVTIVNPAPNRIRLEPKISQSMKSITYKVMIPAGKQAAISLFPTNRNNLGNVTIVIDGRTTSSQMNITGQYYNLGFFPEGREISFEVQFTNSEIINLIEPQILLTDVAAFQRSLDRIQANRAIVKKGNRSATFEVNATKENPILFTTIPNDQGWQAKVDGKKLEIIPFSNGFLTVKLPPGKHTVEFTYLPPGFLIGLSGFVLGTLLFVLIEFRTKIFRKKHHN